MLNVVQAACTFTADRSAGVIILESDIISNFPQAIEELQSTEARNKAISYANTVGISDARINGNAGHPFPINSDGYPLDQVKGPDGGPLPAQHPSMQIARYRVDVPVSKRLL